MLSLIISTVVFFAASFLLHRYLEDWGLDKGRARTLLVIALASLLSYGASSAVGHFTGKPDLIDSALKLQTSGLEK
ncbi:MAG TPA: hypothetical protein VGL38_07350 [bacterium]|jgi:hypothetical protein